MKKRTYLHCLPAVLRAGANVARAPFRRGMDRFLRLFDLAGRRPLYTAVLTADLHADADPRRDRTDVLRLALSGVSRAVGRADAVVMAGDITNCGDEKEYRVLRRLCRAYLRTEKILPAMGNHDSWHHSDNPCFEIARRLFADHLAACGLPADPPGYAYEDRFCTYLVLTGEGTMHNGSRFSAAQLDRFAAGLSVAVRRRKLTVVVCHQPLPGHNGGDESWAAEGQEAAARRLEALLREAAARARRPILFVSGHKHTAGAESLQTQGDRLLFLNLPSLEYGGGDAPPGAGWLLRIRRRGFSLTPFGFIKGRPFGETRSF